MSGGSALSVFSVPLIPNARHSADLSFAFFVRNDGKGAQEKYFPLNYFNVSR
jgi:hypothetical protein